MDPSRNPSSSESLDARKAAVRADMRARRRALPADVVQRHASAVASHLMAWPPFRSAATVAGYVAVGGEADPAPALAAARGAGAAVVYPRVAGPAGQAGGPEPRLRFAAVDDGAFVAGPLGLREPAVARAEVPADGIDVFLVPGLAFAADGRRLGQGGGYYDELGTWLDGRTKGGRTRALFVGLGHGFQLIDDVPAGPRDRRVDAVATEAGVTLCRADALAPPAGKDET